MENVTTLGKLVGLLFCSLHPLYFVFENSKNTRNELARPVIGTIFLVMNQLSSMQAAGIVQDTFAGEAGEGERGRRSGDD